jgi:phosphoribosyl 1,2-cyclic phosphate phosphodiesterase
MIGCQCSTCRSTNPKNVRLRSGAWVRIGNKHLLIDASPDLRQQALRYKIPIPDALLITHTHFDHIGGLEELRAYNVHHRRPIRCFLSSDSYENIKKLFYYHFESKKEERSFSASFDFHVLPPSPATFDVDGLPISTFAYAQGPMTVTGYRIGKLAYVTDIKQFDRSIFEHLTDLDTLLLSAGGIRPSRMQLSLEGALEFQSTVGAKQTYLTHLSHDIEYQAVSATLPKEVALAYDGLQIEFIL